MILCKSNLIPNHLVAVVVSARRVRKGNGGKGRIFTLFIECVRVRRNSLAEMDFLKKKRRIEGNSTNLLLLSTTSLPSLLFKFLTVLTVFDQPLQDNIVQR